MNRNYLSPIASFLVLCFLLVSLVSQASVFSSTNATLHTYLGPKTDKSTKTKAQFIFEEKEGEKGSEKYPTGFNSTHTVKLSSFVYQANFGHKIYRSSHPVSHYQLYLFNRSLLI